MNHTFIKGLEHSDRFYELAVKPILSRPFPDLIYSAALIPEELPLDKHRGM